MGTELETNPETVAELLAAAGVRVRPLVIEREGKFATLHGQYWLYFIGPAAGGYWKAVRLGCAPIIENTEAECIAACEAHHAAAVMAMLEVVPSEEVKL